MNTLQIILLIVVPILITLINVLLIRVLIKRSYYFTKKEIGVIKEALSNSKRNLPFKEKQSITRKIRLKEWVGNFYWPKPYLILN